MLMPVLAGWLLLGCEAADTSTGITSENDFTLSLELIDQTVHVGDETVLTLRFRRTDNSNLTQGLTGEILITTSIHGRVTPARVDVVVFTASRPGVADVRATFRDATALVKVLISSIEL